LIKLLTGVIVPQRRKNKNHDTAEIIKRLLKLLYLSARIMALENIICELERTAQNLNSCFQLQITTKCQLF